MSISGSLSAAMSGLTAASRAAETVSSNVSNALTPGYGRREVQLASGTLGGYGAGVHVAGVQRHSDPILIGNRRLSQSELGQERTLLDFLTRAETAIGTPDDPSSLTGRMNDLNAQLIQAASRPDSAARLQSVLDATQGVAAKLNNISDTVQIERQQADAQIAAGVEFLNTTLGQIADLNGRISQFQNSGYDQSGLLDQRQVLIDQVAELVPVREIPRQGGAVALYTPGGAALLDGKAADIEFTGVGIVTPDMTLTSGGLSGLTINGAPVATGADSGPIAGGKLAGLFHVRDVQAPALQSRLDAVARDLMERFQDPGVDPTLNPGDPGLFTDAGAAFSALDEVGLAGRIAINIAVDPDAGGALWRLRDGIGATTPGDAGNATLLNALADTLESARLPATGGFIAERSANGLASDLLSGVSVELTTRETEVTFLQSQTDSLIGLELQGGVDTDQEMQKLLLIEQNFAANARLVSTIDELIQTLLRL